MAKIAFYAVKVGKFGSNIIYTTWDEAKEAVNGFPGARHRKFNTLAEAQEWLAVPISSISSPFASSSQGSSGSSSSATRLPSSQPLSQSSTAERDYISIPDSPVNVRSPGRSVHSAIEIPDTPSPRKRKDPVTAPLSPLADSRALRRPRRSSSDSDVAPKEEETPPPPASGEIELTKEQEDILDKIRQGKSLFFTGSAGTGKSVLMRATIKCLQSMPGSTSKSVAVTAPTGIAAVNVGGVTLHSFAGIGLGKENVETLVEKIIGQRAVLERWQKTQTLIIDEISMVDGAFFDKLELIARHVRGHWVEYWESTEDGKPKRKRTFTLSQKPFGGIQLVISGDFFQLPPVPEKNGRSTIPSIYAFDAKTWKACVPRCYTLNRVFRQADQRFADMLNKMRVGELEPAAIAQFTRLSRNLIYDDGIEPTQLFSLRSQVEKANSERLVSLPAPTYRFLATDTPGYDALTKRKLSKEDAEKSLDRLIALKEVHLRKGAQVMLIQNMRQGKLVNGSLGRVVDFITPDEASKEHLEIAKPDDRKVPRLRPVPAFNAGKTGSSQPSSYDSDDCVCGEEECTCESGMQLEDRDGQHRWPLVEFINGEKLVLPPVEFSVVNFHGVIEAKRVQIPLILAWALSIHKSQGQTIPRVKVDLGTVFEKGQAYVALSRAVNLQGLQVLNFNPSKVMAHPRVIEWSRGLRVNGQRDESDSDDEDEEESDDSETFEDAVTEQRPSSRASEVMDLTSDSDD